MIPYLGIDTWYCHWNSDHKCQKKILNEITETEQKRANVEKTQKIRSPKIEIFQNRWRTYGCEVRDGDFLKDIWVSILSIFFNGIDAILIPIFIDASHHYHRGCHTAPQLASTSEAEDTLVTRQATHCMRQPRCAAMWFASKQKLRTCWCEAQHAHSWSDLCSLASTGAHFDGLTADGSGCAAHEANRLLVCTKLAVHISALRRVEAASFDCVACLGASVFPALDSKLKPE